MFVIDDILVMEERFTLYSELCTKDQNLVVRSDPICGG